MDQSVLAGVGNVYRSELLYRNRIDLFRPGTTITAAEFDAMWTDLVALMKVGVAREDHRDAARGRPRRAVVRTRSPADRRLSSRRRTVPGLWQRRRTHGRARGAATCSGARPVSADRRTRQFSCRRASCSRNCTARRTRRFSCRRASCSRELHRSPNPTKLRILSDFSARLNVRAWWGNFGVELILVVVGAIVVTAIAHRRGPSRR